MNRQIYVCALVAGSVMVALAQAVQGESVTLAPVADCTLIEDPTGAWANGAGFAFFAGRIGTQGGASLRRGLIRFDTSAIPVGSTVTSAALTMYRVSQTEHGSQLIRLYRTTASWNEGTSGLGSFATGGQGFPTVTGDTTWLHRNYPTVFWATPGGDWSTTLSASTVVIGQGTYQWSAANMTADVQGWVDSPSTNFGWCVIGNESGTLQTTKKFASREWSVVAQRPKLTVVFTPPPPPPEPADLNGDGHVNGLDLALLLGAWTGTSAYSPCPGYQAADLNQDCRVNGLDLALLLGAWG